MNSDIYITCKSLAPIVRFILNKEEQKKGEKINKKLLKSADLLIKRGGSYKIIFIL